MGTTAPPASTTYPFNSALLSEAMKGSTNITFNIASDQAATNPLSDHNLTYIQLGSYYGKLPATTTGAKPSDFTVISQTQEVANEIGAWAAQNAGYKTGDGDPLTWLVSQGKLGTDLSGQANSGSMASANMNIRNLANALYEIAGTGMSLGTRTDISLTGETSTSGTWAAPAPGVYLVIDQDGSNASMPMIISTMPSSDWSVPASMASLITNKVALKTQDPLTPPTKQFAIGANWTTDGVSGGKLASSASATIGSANAVTYQVAGVFPNFYGYPAYSYAFVDNPGVGLTLNINAGQNLAVAGIPISTLMTDAGANNVKVFETKATPSGSTASGQTVTANSANQLTNITNLVGGEGAKLEVLLNQIALKELMTLKAKSTSTTDGEGINTGAALADYQVSAPASDPTGQNNGSKSWTGQTTPTTQYFGLDYQAFLNSKVASGTSMGSSTMGSSSMGSTTGSSSTMGSTTGSSSSRGDSSASPAEGSTTGSTATTKAAAVSMTDMTTPAAAAGVTEAGNTASIINNGTQTGTSSNVPLQSSGSYNGGDTNKKGETSSTTQTNPDTISGTKTNGTTDGVPNKTAVGAGLTWMKIWNSGEVAKGAEFQVQNSDGSYLFATGNGWGWAAQKSGAETFQAATPYNGVNAASDGGLFQISGLGAGTYKVTETQQATGAASVLPSFYVTIASGKPEEITTTAPSGAASTNGFNMASSQGGLTPPPVKRGEALCFEGVRANIRTASINQFVN